MPPLRLRSLLPPLLVLGALLPTAPAQRRARTAIEDMNWDSRPEYTRFVIQLSDAANAVTRNTQSLLPDVPVFYVDLYGMRQSYQDQVIPIDDGLLWQVQIQNYDDRGVVRLIFHVQSVALFNTVAFREEGQALVVDLMRRARAPVDVTGRRRPSALPEIEGETPPSLTRERPPGQRTVVIIDPGHGGQDPGARSQRDGDGARLCEKDLVLDIARLLRHQLEETDEFQAYLTRSDDRTVSLDERVAYARRLSGDIFLSIHANDAGNPQRYRVARGLEIYWLSNRGERHLLSETPSSSSTGRLQTNERIRRMRLESYYLCRDLARSFLRDLYWRPESHGGQGLFRFIRDRNFHVLRNLDMPSALVEVGYVTHREECRLLHSRDFQERIVDRLVEGLTNHVQRIENDRAATGR